MTHRHEHRRVLNLSVISQSKHQTFIVITEEIRKFGNTRAKAHQGHLMHNDSLNKIENVYMKIGRN